MKTKTTMAFGGLVLMLAIGPGAYAQSASCDSVKFSDRVLERFPRAQEACLDVITRDGEQWAVFKADLVRVSGNTVRVRPKLPSGERAPAQSIRFDPQRRVLVNGKSLQARQLALGQELTAYVKVTEPSATLAPADEGEPLSPYPLEAAPEQVASADPAAMPMTASPFPLIGALGMMLLGLGGAVRLWRRRAE
jgi:hypothetical protein